MTREQRAQRGKARKPSGGVFLTHGVEFQGTCPRAWTSLLPCFQGQGLETIKRDHLKTIIIENVVNLKYLIRIYFLEKHELGGVCEACWEGMTPLFLWVWLSLTNALAIGLEMGGLLERNSMVLGKGPSLQMDTRVLGWPVSDKVGRVTHQSPWPIDI